MVKAREKGNRAEREIGEWLLEHDGEHPVYKAITSSCGRVGQYTELQFDVPSFHYACESKSRRTVPKWLGESWKQIIRIAKRETKKHNHKVEPFMFIKANNMSPMHVVTHERHAQLLKYERLCAELGLADAQAAQVKDSINKEG